MRWVALIAWALAWTVGAMGCSGGPSRAAGGASAGASDLGQLGDAGLRIDSVTATAMSSMWKKRDGRPVTGRTLTVSGSLTIGPGEELCRVQSMKLDTVLDERGRDVLGMGTVSFEPGRRPARANWRRDMPAEQTLTSFTAKVEDLDELPRSLSRLAGHIDVVVVDEVREVEFDLKVSETFVDVGPAFSYRVAACTLERNAVSLRIEYRVRAETVVAGVIEAPALLEVMFADGDPSVNISSGMSWPSEKRTGDAMTGEYVRSNRGFVGAAPTRGKLTVVLKARPVRYNFELRDIALTGPGR